MRCREKPEGTCRYVTYKATECFRAFACVRCLETRIFSRL